jgi:hypothetical protein
MCYLCSRNRTPLPFEEYFKNQLPLFQIQRFDLQWFALYNSAER